MPQTSVKVSVMTINYKINYIYPFAPFLLCSQFVVILLSSHDVVVTLGVFLLQISHHDFPTTTACFILDISKYEKRKSCLYASCKEIDMA